MIEAEKLPGLKHVLWKKSKELVFYVGVNKLLPNLEIFSGKAVQVLYQNSGRSTYGTKKLILVNRIIGEVNQTNLKILSTGHQLLFGGKGGWDSD